MVFWIHSPMSPIQKEGNYSKSRFWKSFWPSGTPSHSPNDEPTWTPWHLDRLDRKILNSGSTVVLLNGVPGKFFKCKRGVRQGDPQSPLLFVLAAELLQILVNEYASATHSPAYDRLSHSSICWWYFVDHEGRCTTTYLPKDLAKLFFAESTCLKVNYNVTNAPNQCIRWKKFKGWPRLLAVWLAPFASLTLVYQWAQPSQIWKI
jgi:hypothetical protein